MLVYIVWETIIMLLLFPQHSETEPPTCVNRLRIKPVLCTVSMPALKLR